MNALNNAGIFLIQTLFDLYIFVVILRLVLQSVRANYYHPVVQMVVKLTDPLVKPLQKIFPYFHNVSTGILFLLLVLEILKIICITLLVYHALLNVLNILLWAVINLVTKFLNFYFYAIIIRAIMSWLAPTQQSPIFILLYQITEPLLHPVRRFLPAMAGLDLSPLVVMIILQVLSILLTNSLAALV